MDIANGVKIKIWLRFVRIHTGIKPSIKNDIIVKNKIPSFRKKRSTTAESLAAICFQVFFTVYMFNRVWDFLNLQSNGFEINSSKNKKYFMLQKCVSLYVE